VSCRVCKTRRKYRECTRRRNAGGGNTRDGAGRRNASLPHGAQWSRTSLSTHAATSSWSACHHVGVGTAETAGRCATTSQTVASEQPRLRYRGDQSAFRNAQPSGEAYIGSGHNDKRYRHHQPASRERRGLPVLIHTNPNIQSCTQPLDPIATAGATLIGA
jgi:hypothetical protein